MSGAARLRSRSLWLDQLDEPLVPRPPLTRSIDVDVAIVGGGYTGLWTAFALRDVAPELSIALLEREQVGFGASGRNGGWCSALFAASPERLARAAGPDAARALARALRETVGHVGEVCRREGIDAAYHRGGTLAFATRRAHEARLRRAVAAARAHDPDACVEWLDAEAAFSRVAVQGTLGAAFTPHCARVQPAALARGLARAVEARGATIYEHTPAFQVERGRVRTAGGDVRAGVVVRATEAFTPQFARWRRAVVPVYSFMIATAPLEPGVWERIGWDGFETLTDGRHLLVYAQRTADDRIAFGGRGAPYHFGSRVGDRFDRAPRVFGALEQALARMFPAAAAAPVTHRWGGAVAAARDWFPSVGFDRANGFGWAGGYVGDGVAAACLAGRTLAELVAGCDTERTRLPWVGHRSPAWEPEPFRWLGINAGLAAARWADRAEMQRGRRARLAERLLARLE